MRDELRRSAATVRPFCWDIQWTSECRREWTVEEVLAAPKLGPVLPLEIARSEWRF